MVAVGADCFEVGVLGCASFCEAGDMVDFEGYSCCSAVGAGVVVSFEDAFAGGGGDVFFCHVVFTPPVKFGVPAAPRLRFTEET